MNTASAIAKRLLTNKWFWIALAALIVALILRKYSRRIGDTLHKWFGKDYGSDAAEPSLTNERKRQLEQLAQELYAEFDGLTWSTAVFNQVHALQLDSELRYLARYYADIAGEPLRTAIDNEAIAGDKDAELIARLQSLNL